jgi:hypothetical protein
MHAEQEIAEPFGERHYTINELASAWRFSGEFVRQLVQHEPGVTEWVRQQPGRVYRRALNKARAESITRD